MNIQNNIKEICIIGCGTYGSYIAKRLSDKNVNITIIEVGNSQIKSEKDIGFFSKFSGIKYDGLSKGRFFGFGGTSAKWGGQLLFFSEKDFANPNPFLKSITELNLKHKKKVLNFFGITDSSEDQYFNKEFFIKNGIWLNYYKRNLFKLFNIKKQSNVKIISNSRVIKIDSDNKQVKYIYYVSNGIQSSITADYFYLTTGAFESARLLINSSIIQPNKLNFSDHYSKKFVKIFGKPHIQNLDLTFNFTKDYSLRTSRLVGELVNQNISYFIHPIYNSEFQFFQNFKTILFKKDYKKEILINIIKDLPSVFNFIYHILFLKKLYIKDNTWYMQIDIESHIENSEISISKNLDSYNQNGLDINIKSIEKIEESFTEIENKIICLLKEQNIKYEICNNEIEVNKIEDTYHPYKITSDFTDINSYFNFFKNMLIVNTGILPRVGGINPTAALFPLIEENITINFENI